MRDRLGLEMRATLDDLPRNGMNGCGPSWKAATIELKTVEAPDLWHLRLSFPREREFRGPSVTFWMPAFAGMTGASPI
jgi:hypothetical protein